MAFHARCSRRGARVSRAEPIGIGLARSTARLRRSAHDAPRESDAVREVPSRGNFGRCACRASVRSHDKRSSRIEARGGLRDALWASDRSRVAVCARVSALPGVSYDRLREEVFARVEWGEEICVSTTREERRTRRRTRGG